MNDIHKNIGFAKGLRPADHSRAHLKFGDFLTTMPTAPLVDTPPNLSFPMDGNDLVGCCVVAGWDHFRQVVTQLLTGTGLNFTQAEIWKFYQTQNPGFDPNGSSTTNGPGSSHDNGMNIQQFLGYLQQNKYILGFAKIDYTNLQQMQAAIWLGLSVITGVILDNVQMDQFASGTWDNVPGSSVDGGHCVPAHGYNMGTIDVITWAKSIACTPAFIKNQMDEAWFVLTQYHVDHPNFRNHFDLAAFSAAVKAITNGQVIIPVPAPVSAPLFSQTLHIGMSGPDVVKLQTILGITADGKFGPNTLKAVETFQSLHGLVPDGVVGPKTMAALAAVVPPAPTPAPVSGYPMLLKWCAAAQVYEGWSTNPPSRSCTNNNPGNIEFVGQPNAVLENGHNPNRFAHFNTYTDGLQALYNLFLGACTGHSSIYHPTMTLLDFYNVYAPSSDGNNVNDYANSIASALGVPVTTQISTFVV